MVTDRKSNRTREIMAPVWVITSLRAGGYLGTCVMRWALGPHGQGGLGLGWQWLVYPKCALSHACTRGGWLGLHLRQ